MVYNYFRAIKRKLFNNGVFWSGDYKQWDEAQKKCSGYSEELILEKVKAAALAVKRGEASYERDSVLFYKPQIAEQLVSSLLNIAGENNGHLNILDFGGSLGSLYYQNREALASHCQFTWNIVEQAHYVRSGKQYFADAELNFFDTIHECLSNGPLNVVLAACVLQYIKDPYYWMEQFMNTGAKYIILDRMGFIESTDDVLTIQKVPPTIYEGSYPCYFFNKQKVLSFLEKKGFILVTEWPDHITAAVKVNGKNCYWSTLVCKKNVLIDHPSEITIDA